MAAGSCLLTYWGTEEDKGDIVVLAFFLFLISASDGPVYVRECLSLSADLLWKQLRGKILKECLTDTLDASRSIIRIHCHEAGKMVQWLKGVSCQVLCHKFHIWRGRNDPQKLSFDLYTCTVACMTL